MSFEHTFAALKAARRPRDDAASAMLAALIECQEHVGLVRLQTGFSIVPIRKRVADAIAAAKAAGIIANKGEIDV